MASLLSLGLMCDICGPPMAVLQPCKPVRNVTDVTSWAVLGHRSPPSTAPDLGAWPVECTQWCPLVNNLVP